EEMAGQPGVLWFAVTDAQGVIITHSNPGMVGKSLYSPSEMHHETYSLETRFEIQYQIACEESLDNLTGTKGGIIKPEPLVLDER
ncbi:hypothetical protein ONJ87_25695, partial [Salmonella enterica subsp. enterica serovar Anatum]|nr:hypothetical protein [Salmonella enterica subsp. enterica serovar Anatum]